MAISDEPEGGELPALRDLVQSEGWRLFTAAYLTGWGAEATLSRIEAMVATVPVGDQAAVQDMTQHILTAQKHIRALMAWPDQRIRELAQPGKRSHWIDRHRRV